MRGGGLLTSEVHYRASALHTAYSAFRDQEYSAFFDEIDATELPRAVREDGRKKSSQYLAYKSVAAPCTHGMQRFRDGR